MADFTKTDVNSIPGTASADLIFVGIPADALTGTIDGAGGRDELRFTGTAGQTLVLGGNLSNVELVTIGTGSGAEADASGTTAEGIDASALGTAVELRGNAGANVLIGGDGNDVLVGGAGNDTLDGGTGDDTYVVDSVGDHVCEFYSGWRASTASDGAQGNGDSQSAVLSSDGRYVTFHSAASNLVAGDTNGQIDIFVKDLLAGTTTRVSTASDGTQANGQSYAASLSADGRYVTFQSSASNLVAGDTNGTQDSFIKDLQTGAITRFSTASDGAQANAQSVTAAISADGRYVTFDTNASNLVAGDTNGRQDIFLKDLQTNSTTRVSTASDGTQGNGDSQRAVLSADGRYMAFQSSASNLVAGDTNGTWDIFVKDLQTGATTRASTGSDGIQTNSLSYTAALSADGRYVSFQSAADNLVAGDTNGSHDIYVKDLQTGSTTRISTASDGTQGNSDSNAGALSADGRYVTFWSYASNLVAGDTNGTSDIFVKDLLTGVVTRLSIAVDGVQANGDSYNSALSPDGHYITFESNANNLDASDINNTRDIFVVPTLLAAASGGTDTVRASVNYSLGTGLERLDLQGTADLTGTGNELDNQIAGNSGNNVLAGLDGNDTLDGGAGNDQMTGGTGNDTYYVDALGDTVSELPGAGTDTVVSTLAAYTLGSDLENLTLGGSGNNNATGNTMANLITGNSGNNLLDGKEGADTLMGGAGNDTYIVDNAGDVVIEPVIEPTIQRISTAGDGTQGNSQSTHAALSADGRYVTFQSDASNLVAGDTNGAADIFVKDLQTGATTRVSTAGDDVQGNSASLNAALSADGRYVTFQSDASNLVAGDTNGLSDVFVKDLQTGATTRVSTAGDDVQGNSASLNAALSADGRYVSFQSTASNLVVGDTNGATDIFVKDLQTGTTIRISTSADGTQGNDISYEAELSADGRYVAFQSLASNLVAGDTNTEVDIFVKDLQTGAITRVSTAGDGTQANDYSFIAALSADGRYVAFHSLASNLVAGDTNNLEDIFVKDLQTGAITRASTSADGTQANLGGTYAALSANGRYVTFQSYAHNLVADENNNSEDIFVKDLLTGATTRVSTAADGAQANSGSLNAALSADGQMVVFVGSANNLVAGDTNGATDLFLVVNPLWGGNDIIQSAVSYTSALGVEQLVLTGTVNIDGTGTAQSETITGNNGRNVLSGLGGDDALYGGVGNDVLNGGSGNDSLDGGLGNDIMAGGSGNDTYIVSAARDVVREGSNEGIDTVISAVTYSLAWSELENVTLTGSAALRATGNTFNNVLTGNTGINILDGGLGHDLLYGGAGNDSLIGRAGNDLLDGGAGKDSLNGGAGHDTYVVDSLTDTITEAGPATDSDTVQSTVTWTLGANLEVLIHEGTGNVNGTGNALDNHIYGNAGNNVLKGLAGNDWVQGGAGNDMLDGGAGADKLIGGTGNDNYVVDSDEDSVTELADEGSDTLVIAYANATTDPQAIGLPGNFENITITGTGLYDLIGGLGANVLTGNASVNALFGFEGDDTLIGGAGNDYLDGGDGNDVLDGGLGIDQMEGGAGDDIYTVDVAGDLVIEGADGGTDTVKVAFAAATTYTLLTDLENATITSAAASNLTGNAVANVLTGNAAANILNGLGGADTLIGGLGGDTYVVDDAGDVVTETSALATEIDTVLASVNFTLGANLEKLTLTGADSLNGSGNALANIITGNGGNNVLDGGAAKDTLIGGLGNDTYVVDGSSAATWDTVTELAGVGSGTDTVNFAGSGTYTLGLNVENLTLLEAAGASNGTGNAVDNVLIGNSVANVLNGAAGNDSLVGGAGNDTLIGGAGNDMLTGGADTDFFVFNLAAGATNRDTVTDFESGTDVLRFDNAVFTAVGPDGALNVAAFAAGNFTGGQDATDRIVYNTSTGALYYDADGINGVAAVQVAVLQGLPDLAATDIFVM